MNSAVLPLIVNLAPMGAVADVGKNPHVPISVAAILEDVIQNTTKGSRIDTTVSG